MICEKTWNITVSVCFCNVGSSMLPSCGHGFSMFLLTNSTFCEGFVLFLFSKCLLGTLIAENNTDTMRQA